MVKKMDSEQKASKHLSKHTCISFPLFLTMDML